MDLKLTASTREANGKQLRAVRAQGALPGVVYGHRKEAQPVLLDGHQFRKVFATAGRTHLVDLLMDGGRAQKVLIKEVQTHPRRPGAQHVDLYRIDLKEKLQIEVPISIIGESPAVKRGDGDLLVSLHELRVECLPGDIPESIEVDVSGLDAVDDSIRVHDVQLGSGVTLLTVGDEMIVKVQAHRVQEEEPAAEAAGEAAATDSEASESQDS
jgi:large subunit ribosomal protein L25